MPVLLHYSTHGGVRNASQVCSLFKDGGICICDRDITYVDARDAVAAIVEDGGLPVLAHPGQLDSYDLVEELVPLGLAGIEQHHSDHAPADHARCAQLAERFCLFSSPASTVS